MFKAQVEPRAAGKWYLHGKVLNTHFDVISMADKSTDHGVRRDFP